MKVKSELILASKNSVTGVNLYTFVLVYPRVILPEVNTHRMLSRNTASSRAIPSKKQRAKVLHDPFVPISIGANQKGMQAGEELTGWRRTVAIQAWKLTRYAAVAASWVLDKVGAHKQIVNRIVEPWTWTQQIVTCTDLKNFFKLRDHPDAEPHFQALARQMHAQVEYADWALGIIASGKNPTTFNLPPNMSYQGVGELQVIGPGAWHLPFIDSSDRNYITSDGRFSSADLLKRVSTARCARVSYTLPENGSRSIPERDLELCARLSGSGHWSPFEHVATPMKEDVYFGNFRSWMQYRKEYAEEHGGDR